MDTANLWDLVDEVVGGRVTLVTHFRSVSGGGPMYGQPDRSRPFATSLCRLLGRGFFAAIPCASGL